MPTKDTKHTKRTFFNQPLLTSGVTISTSRISHFRLEVWAVMNHAAWAQMKEYDIYVPLHNNDGSPIDPGKLASIKKRLVDHFGGLTHFPQENEGLWKVGSFTFRDRIVILRVLTGDPLKAQMFFAQLKKEIKQGFGQEDVLIVVRDVKTV